MIKKGSSQRVAAAAAGQRLAELYRQFGPAIYSRCRRALKDSAAAEDATQEVFLRMDIHLESLPAEETPSLLAWVNRVATNYCLNVLRNQARQAEPTAEIPEQAGEHPEPELVERDLARQLLSQAPDKLQAPARLYYVEEMPQEQIAGVLGISRRTVLHRLAAFSDSAQRYLRAEQARAATSP